MFGERNAADFGSALVAGPAVGEISLEQARGGEVELGERELGAEPERLFVGFAGFISVPGSVVKCPRWAARTTLVSQRLLEIRAPY